MPNRYSIIPKSSKKTLKNGIRASVGSRVPLECIICYTYNGSKMIEADESKGGFRYFLATTKV
jgi:hypothetical protein